MSRRPRAPRRRYPLTLHLRSALSRRRRLAAALLAGLAVSVVVLRLAPPGAVTVPVVTAAAPLSAGTVVRAEHLTVAGYPHGLAPEGSVADPADLLGRTLAAAAGPGEPLTAAGVVGPGLLTGQPAGVTAVTLRIDDPGVLRHVRAGDHVDVVHLPDGSTVGPGDVLGRGLPVLWVASGGGGTGTGLLAAPAGAEEEGLLVVAAPHADGPRLAAAAGTGRTTVVLVPAPVTPSAAAVAP